MFGRRVPSQQQDFGLLIAGKNTKVPLKEVTVKAQLRGYLVGLCSTLKYSNEGSNPIEVLFRFPIEESYAVVGLEAEIGGKRIKAEVREKEEAKQMYDDAMASGFTAALAEEKSGDIFSISLGNLPPKSDAKLHLKLAGELALDADGAVRFSLPAVLKPRYTPTGSSDPLKPVGFGVESGIAHGSLPAVFNFEMDALDETSVSHITSPTHTITTMTKPGRIHVTLGNAIPLDKDLVILAHLKEAHTPRAIPELGDRKLSQKKFMGSPAVMLNFFPKFESKKAACEFVFIVDRSGSMNGSFIRSASETLVLFLKSIPPGCSFNIIGFGSSYRTLFPSSVPYNQSNLDVAIQHAETLRADLGGTELLSPLKYVFSQPLLPGLPRQVFVLTDGSVSNTNACIQEVRENVKYSRVFTFGIGSGASTALVKGLAKTGNGTAEFIKEEERLQPKVISSLKRALQPSVTNLEVKFDVTSGFDALEAPDKLPTIFNGDKTVIYGIFRSKAVSDSPMEAGVSGTATLTGKILGVSFEHSIPFQIPPPSDASDTDSFQMPIVHQLAAKSLIRDWEHKEGWASTASENERKQEIIRVSIESSVVSTHTAYIAVDEEQDKPIEGAIQTWDLTATMTAGGGGFGYGGFGGAQYSLRSAYTCNYAGGGGGGMMFGGGPPPPPMAAMAMPPELALQMPIDAAPQSMMGGFAFGGSGPPPPPPTGGMGFSSGPPPPPPTGRMASSSGPQAFPMGISLNSGIPSAPSRQAQQFASLDLLCSSAPPPPPASDLDSRVSYNLFSFESSKEKSAPARSHAVGRSLGKVSAATSSDELTQLISLQQAEGYWILDKVSNFVKKSITNPISGVAPNVWATVVALILLESRFSQQEDEWELVAMKGEMWLSAQILPPGVDVEKLKEEAKKLL